MMSMIRPKAADLLKFAHCNAFLISTVANIFYLTGLRVSAGLLLAQRSGYTLFLDRRYLEAARQNIRKGILLKGAESIQDTLLKLKAVALESDDITLSRFAVWKKKYKNTKFVQSSGVVEEFRRSKAGDERRKILKACAISKSVLRLIPTLLVPGISEKDLAWRIESECRRRSADGMAFGSIVAFGANTARPHHHPTDRRLKKGDLVQIDMGATYDGYCSDYSRVFFTGKPTSDQKFALHALKKASASAVALLKPGVTNRALDICARKVLKSFG
jgi:Xaa-Pro aminopeptidase